MTTPDPDAYWRRPAESPAEVAAPAHPPPPEPKYSGPPRGVPPPLGWRTPVVAEPHSPRPMPKQDHTAMDAAERDARTVTYGVGILAGAILLVLMFVICARLIG
ncbi:MAG TPA: translation initiation factor 2 [Micromonosporaceae bacterium]|nr:translation initiation factor 2 [Micromonosporaceae bacterium]